MTTGVTLRVVLEGWRERLQRELSESVVPFWVRHSLDREQGGYFDALDRDGSVFDTTKHIARQAEEIATFCALAAHDSMRDRCLEIAEHGMRFLSRVGRGAFVTEIPATTRDGKPLAREADWHVERACATAFAAFARAQGDPGLGRLARGILAGLLEKKERSAEGRVGERRRWLGSPLFFLDAIESIDPARGEFGRAHRACLDALRVHVRSELGLVVDVVGAEGGVVEGSEGRRISPGRALEAGRRLLEDAALRNDREAASQALDAIEGTLDFAWDDEEGGLPTYLDRDGLSPLEPEWIAKSWWAHCEALHATLLGYAHTRAPRWLERFEQVGDYTLTRFPDPSFGEWFATLDRRGEVLQRFKAGGGKGCSHVPRTLVACERLLEGLLATPDAAPQ